MSDHEQAWIAAAVIGWVGFGLMFALVLDVLRQWQHTIDDWRQSSDEWASIHASTMTSWRKSSERTFAAWQTSSAATHDEWRASTARLAAALRGEEADRG